MSEPADSLESYYVMSAGSSKMPLWGEKKIRTFGAKNQKPKMCIVAKSKFYG